MGKINTLKSAQENYVSAIAMVSPLLHKRIELQKEYEDKLTRLNCEIHRFEISQVFPAKQEIDFCRREGRIENLLIVACNAKNACAFQNFANKAQVQQIFESPLCINKPCVSREICFEISHLAALGNSPIHATGSKAKTVRKSSSSRKSSSDNIPIEKDFDHKGIVIYSFANETFKVSYDSNGNDNGKWDSYKKSLSNTIGRKKAIELGLSQGQYSGLMHRGSILAKLK